MNTVANSAVKMLIGETWCAGSPRKTIVATGTDAVQQTECAARAADSGRAHHVVARRREVIALGVVHAKLLEHSQDLLILDKFGHGTLAE